MNRYTTDPNKPNTMNIDELGMWVRFDDMQDILRAAGRMAESATSLVGGQSLVTGGLQYGADITGLSDREITRLRVVREYNDAISRIG